MHPKTLENVDNYSPKALGSQNLHQAAAYENRTKRAASPQNTVTLKPRINSNRKKKKHRHMQSCKASHACCPVRACQRRQRPKIASRRAHGRDVRRQPNRAGPGGERRVHLSVDWCTFQASCTCRTRKLPDFELQGHLAVNSHQRKPPRAPERRLVHVSSLMHMSNSKIARL